MLDFVTLQMYGVTCATDAHRLYWKQIQDVDKATEKINIILPKTTVRLMLECFKEDNISIEITSTHIAIYNGTFRLVSRLIDARYPDCEIILDQYQENTNEFACKRKQFNSLLRFALPFVSMSTKQIKFKLSGLSMEANTGDADFSSEFYQKMPLYQNTLKPEDSIEIALNGGFLMEVLKTSKDEFVKVKYSSPTRALILDDCVLLIPLLTNSY